MKIITIEEHFMLKNISQRVTAFNIKQNGGMPPANAAQKELTAFSITYNGRY